MLYLGSHKPTNCSYWRLAIESAAPADRLTADQLTVAILQHTLEILP